MRAAWDWHLPVATEEQQRAVVAFAGEPGFDTLIVAGPTEAIARGGKDYEVKRVAIITPYPEPQLAAPRSATFSMDF